MRIKKLVCKDPGSISHAQLSLNRWGLGAEVQASEVRSQGEDWGWMREHSLKGIVRHS